MANEFLQLAVEIARTDSESYVRASALIFISTSVRINKLWNEKLSQFDLSVCIIKKYSQLIVYK